MDFIVDIETRVLCYLNKPPLGIEPKTLALQVPRSTTELYGHNVYFKFLFFLKNINEYLFLKNKNKFKLNNNNASSGIRTHACEHRAS